MSTIRIIFLLSSLVISSLCDAQQTSKKQPQVDQPVIPVGYDAYRMWDKWPQQRLGMRAYMRSTYDRRGANEGADASHFLFAGKEDENVSLDVKGNGVLYFFRANHWHGSPWHFIVDGKDNIVRENGTEDPVNAKTKLTNTTFIPEKAFPQPLNWTWATTRGADLIWTPMPFSQSMRIAYSRTHYGTGYYIYHLFGSERNLSRPIRPWDISQVPDQDVLALIGRAGTDIAPQNIKKISGKVKLNKSSLTLARIMASNSSVRAFKLTLPLAKALDLERVGLRITWDGAKYPSVDAPLCLFFGAGTLYNRDQQEFLVKGFPINIRFDYEKQQVELACYYPMPFFKEGRFELTGIKPDQTEIGFEIRYEPLRMLPNQSSYFHATYKDFPTPEPGKDMVFLDTRGMEGHSAWSGSFVGTSFIFSHDAYLGTLEGDPRFFFDDSQTPQAYGTGTEEWGGGGDYWGGRNMTLPFAGHPCGAPKKNEVRHEKDLIQSAYRFLLADMMPFGRRAQIQFEHGGENLSTEHYESVAYWYGLPAASLILTDSLNIGDLASEKSHRYQSPEASEVQRILSRYEWGIDSFPKKHNAASGTPAWTPGAEVYPAHEETGRFTMGVSEFTVKLDPSNQGALLRRTLDYSFPNQTAEVFISDASGGKGREQAKWERVGIWYLAGSNTCIYSNPGGELDPRKLVVQTSNRRFRDDEFLIQAELTKGRSAVHVGVRFIPDTQELFPGYPFPQKSAWSELRYKVYSYILPRFKEL